MLEGETLPVRVGWGAADWPGQALYVHMLVIAGSTFVLLDSCFFPWLPSARPRYVWWWGWRPDTSLVLPITLCLGPLVQVLGCNGLGFDDSGHLLNYKLKNMRNMGPNKCVGGIIHVFFYKGMDQDKEESTQYFCTACNNNYMHI